MRKNIKHVFFALMIMLLFIPSFAAAQSKITADYVQSGNNADITITGDRNKAVSITIKDEFRYYFIDQGTTDDKGKAAFSAVLATDKTYECLVNIDGELLNVNIVMKKSGTDPEIPNDKYADLYIKGYRGLILDKSNIKLKDRESVLKFTERILDENNISYENRNGYIAGIDGQNEFDKGSGSGWMFSVNGVFPNIGSGKVILKDGDSVRWLYTENLGEDVGGKVYPRNTGMDDLDKSIKDALKIVKDEKASAKDISKALESIVGCMKNVADNPDSVTEGQMLEVSGRISEVLLIASKNAKSEELSVKVCETALSITNMMNDSVKSAAEMDKLSKIAGKNMYVSLSSVLRMSDKNKAGKLVDSAIEISSKVEKRLAETIKNPNKDFAAGIRITDAEGSELGADILLPKILIEKSLNKGIQTINISSELLSIQIAPDFMGTDLKDNLRIELEKADNSINMRFVQENETLKSLRKPVKVVLPLHESMNDNDNISVLLTDGGLKENIGGMYSSSDNSIKFLTYKPGNFSVQNNEAEFNDLAEYKWAEHAINSMASKGIISGRTPGSFDPSAKITRAEFSALVSRMMKYGEALDKKLPFNDVDGGKWYYGSILTAYENGLVSGKSPTDFEPDSFIKREEMSKILGQVIRSNLFKKQDAVHLSKFEDSEKISPWAVEGAVMMSYNKVMNGHEGRFYPGDYATRAETAVMLYKIYELILD